MTYKSKTLINLSIAGIGEDNSVQLEIEYSVRKGSAPTSQDPGEGASVDITKATVTDSKGIRYRAHDWLWEIMTGADELTSELLSEAAAADESARDDAAELRRAS